MLWIAPLAVLLITFVFSMLGMGGGQLIIPVLFWLGLDFKTQAIPTGLLCGAVSATSAAVTYARKGTVRWRVAGPFLLGMVGGPVLGTRVNLGLPTRPIIVLFAVFTAAAAILMLSGYKPRRGELSRRGQWLVGLFGGLGLGFLVGLIGRGGGSFVVPLLYLCGLDPKAAAATSAAIVTTSNWAGFFSHLTHARLSAGLMFACAIAALVGSQAGSHLMIQAFKPRQVKIVFGVVLLLVAALLVVKDVLGLISFG